FVHAMIRKSAHVVEYLVLGVLLVRALREEGLVGLPLILTAILLGGGWAMMDELHQEVVPSRTASPRDVAVDTSGVFAGVALALPGRRQLLRSPASAPVENCLPARRWLCVRALCAPVTWSRPVVPCC